MKKELALCSLALNPQAPSPTASMVRVNEGRMESFGGTFCISIPVSVEVGCCFDPTVVSTFFRKERKLVSYTLHKKKLILQEGKEKLSVAFLLPEEMPILDVLAKPVAVEFDMTFLKVAADVVNPSHHKLSCQGVQFRQGMLFSGDGHIVVAAVTDFPDNLIFNLPVASAKALLRFNSKVVSIGLDSHAVKFYFADGSSLTSLLICEEFLNVNALFDGEWDSLKLTEDLAKDLLSISCDKVIFYKGNAIYTKGASEGQLTNCCEKTLDFIVNKTNLDTLLKVSSDIHINADNNRLMAVSDLCRVISVTTK